MLPEGFCTDRGCNQEAIAVKKQRQISFGKMDINNQTHNNVGHCLEYGSKLVIAQSSTCFR